MAEYNYEGSLAAYFLLTILILILIPLTFSFRSSNKPNNTGKGCECSECVEQRAQFAKSASKSPFAGLSTKAILTIAGWGLFLAVLYVVVTTQTTSTVYDPFTILGISPSATEKEIKKHFKNLSLIHHPDKVKLKEGQTMDEANEYFIKLTKAYKALTDEEVRRNYLEYGHPDGKQTVSIGLALPAWIIDSHNNIWVLGFYGILFGGLLPYFVGRWWFGSRSRTKDGVQAQTASRFFKEVTEEVTPYNLLQTLSKGLENERGDILKSRNTEEFKLLEKQVLDAWGQHGVKPEELYRSPDKIALSDKAAEVYVLLSAHLFRIPVPVQLKKVQRELLLHLPVLLNSLLSMALSHNWLTPTLDIMHLNAYFAQALRPGASPLLQFPGVTEDDVKENRGKGIGELISRLEQCNDKRSTSIQKAADQWGKLDIVDAKFKVIDERIITPGAFVNIVFKARLTSPLAHTAKSALGLKSENSVNEEEEEEAETAFLLGKKEGGDLKAEDAPQSVHAPRWPTTRKPGWWCFVSDHKNSRVFVSPFRFTDVPRSDPSKERNYRTYKFQFQAPQTVGTYTLRLLFVNDTFVGEDVGIYVQLKVDDASALQADEQDVEDDISEPEEDSLAGQMALMRGGAVKKSKYHGESDDDEESSTDDDEESGTESSDDED